MFFYREKKIKNLVNEKDKLIALSIKEEEKREEVALRANMFSSEYNPQEMVMYTLALHYNEKQFINKL